MKSKNYESMTKTEIINLLNLKRRYYDCFGGEYRNGVEVYQGETETEKARYVYTLDNIMSNDLDDGKIYFLTVERYSKTATVWSDLFNTFIPRKTSKSYEIRG